MREMTETTPSCEMASHVHQCPECYTDELCTRDCSMLETKPGERARGSATQCDACELKQEEEHLKLTHPPTLDEIRERDAVYMGRPHDHHHPEVVRIALDRHELLKIVTAQFSDARRTP